jgi:hypothetical protein
MEKVLLMTIKPCDVLLFFEVLPANDAFFFTVVESSSELEFGNRSENIYLMVEVLKPIHINVQIVLNNLFKNQKSIDYNKYSK